jgi:hypothetical protein
VVQRAYIVTQDKLALFLEEEVANRALRTRGKKSGAAKEVELEKHVLSYASVRAPMYLRLPIYGASKAR